jgi:hypothetical protein
MVDCAWGSWWVAPASEAIFAVSPDIFFISCEKPGILGHEQQLQY